MLLFYFEILLLFSLCLNLIFLHENKQLLLSVTLGAEQVKELAETRRRCLISIQVVLEVTGVLPGSQLVHQTLDLSSCQERQTHLTSAGLTANICSCFHGNNNQVWMEAREHTIVSNPLNVGAACLNQALGILCSNEGHFDRNVHLGGRTLSTETQQKRENINIHGSDWPGSQHVYQH